GLRTFGTGDLAAAAPSAQTDSAVVDIRPYQALRVGHERQQISSWSLTIRDTKTLCAAGRMGPIFGSIESAAGREGSRRNWATAPSTTEARLSHWFSSRASPTCLSRPLKVLTSSGRTQHPDLA